MRIRVLATGTLLLAGLLLTERSLAASNKFDLETYVTEQSVQETYDLIRNVLSPRPSSLSLTDARRILTSAVLSAMAQTCRVPWESRFYLPMMAHLRHVRKLSEPEMSVIGVVHGMQQGLFKEELGTGSCTPDARDYLLRVTSDPS